MKALTLHQPHASLVALGVKSIETRSWRAPVSLVGQRFAIHAAAKRPGNPGDHVGDWTITRDPDGWGIAWNPHSPALAVLSDDGPAVEWSPLPLGAVVATAVLADCVPISDDEDRNDHYILSNPTTGELTEWPEGWWDMPRGADPWTEHVDQLPYGDFTPGRWAWLLDSVEPVTERCPACRGNGRCPACSSRWWGDRRRCETRDGAGRCYPILAKGRQGLWEWTP